MPITIDAVPSKFSANSYAVLTEADAFFEARYGASDWDAATDDQKSAALVEAAKIVDSFRFRGGKYRLSPLQPLEFPRDWQEFKSGTIDSVSLDGTDRVIVDADYAGEEDYPDDYFNGWALEMRTGDAEYELLRIQDFARATGTFTLDGDFSVAPDADDQYYIIEKIPNEIKYATYEIATWLLSGAGDSLGDPSITNYSIGEFSETFAEGVDARIPARAKYYLKKYITRLGNITS